MLTRNSVVGLLVVGICLTGVASGFEVYLRELTIFTTHDRWTDPSVYLTCDDDGRGEVDLPDVKDTYTPYKYGPEEVSATHLADDECRSCTLKERDAFTSDDTFGTFELCQFDFEVTGQYRTGEPDEFDALFECLGCMPPPPPPPEPAPVPVPEPEVVYVPVPGEKQVVYVETQSGESSDNETSEGGEGGRTSSMASPIVLTVLVVCMLVGLVFGGVSYRCYRVVKEQAEEERIRDLDAILGDPEVDFEEIVEQDEKAFNLKFWKHLAWSPGKGGWNRIKEEDNADMEGRR